LLEELRPQYQNRSGPQRDTFVLTWVHLRVLFPP
jgi:hypothetical protein